MDYSCPECKTALDFEVSNIELILLRLKCKKCGKILSLSHNDLNLLDVEEKNIKIDKMKDMISIAFADGIFSQDEKEAIFKKANEYNIPENIVKQIIADHEKNKLSSQPIKLIKEYDENLHEYQNSESKFFDTDKFYEKISKLSIDNPNLKKYREDLLYMIKSNQEFWLERASFWESIYNQSNLETEWREARNHMDKCLEFNQHTKDLYDRVLTFKKSDLIEFSKAMIEKDENDWE